MVFGAGSSSVFSRQFEASSFILSASLMMNILWSDSSGLSLTEFCKFLIFSILINFAFSSLSIQKISGWLWPSTRMQFGHELQESLSLFLQLRAFASSFANKVFPTPSCPVKIYA